MSKYKSLTGINIQWPWSEFLLNGTKLIETRGYPLYSHLQNVEIAVIQTPGKNGKRLAGVKSAKIVGTIIFESSFKYKNKKHWLSDKKRHLVEPEDTLFGFDPKKEKWGWVVKSYTRLDTPVAAPVKRGIILAKNCKVPKV